MAAPQQQRGVDGWRQPAGREGHSTAVVDNQLYLWGGLQDGMPRVHDSAEKRQFFSSVEVFNVTTGCWEQRTTSGTPPLGVVGYSCVAVRNELHYFGGECGHSNCYHNSVHTLSTSTLQWRMLAPSIPESGAPIQKHRCGMVHFTDGEEDLLYVVAGYGCPVPSSPQHGAQYLNTTGSGVHTNEQHIFSLSTNQWSSPVVTGQTPPPCSSFSLTAVKGKKAAMFGGPVQSSYHDRFSSSSNEVLYIVDLERHSVKWSMIKKPTVSQSVQFPGRRYAHAASHITGPVFVMSGGCGDGHTTLSDVWLCDITHDHCLWNKLPTVLNSVTKRSRHSVSVIHLGTRCVWVLVFGGSSYKAGTSIIELIQDTSGQWCVERVMERETLSNSTEYQKRLREAKIKGGEEQILDYASRQQESESYLRKINELEKEVKVLKDQLQQTKKTLQKVQQELHEQTVTGKNKSEVQDQLQQQYESKIHELQKQFSCEQDKIKKKEIEIQYLRQELMITREQANMTDSEEKKLVHELQQQLSEYESVIQELKQKLTHEQNRKEESQQPICSEVEGAAITSDSVQSDLQKKLREKEEELHKSKKDLEYYQRRISEMEEEIRVLKDRVIKTDNVNQQHDQGTGQDTQQSNAFSQAPSNADLMIRVAHKISTHWYHVGVMLDIETATLNRIEKEITDHNQVRLYLMVFDQWKQEEKIPYTWETIINKLETLGEKKTATELKKWLNEEISSA